MSASLRRKAARIFLWAVAASISWLVILAVLVIRFGQQSSEQSADAALVLGAAVQDDKPSPVFQARLDHAIALYRAGRVRYLVLTGGVGAGDTVAESEAGAKYAADHGVNTQHILIEKVSRTTQQNLTEAKRVMDRAKIRSCLLVSDPLHMRRAVLMMKDLGFEGYPSPTTTSRYTSYRSQIPFLLRELYFHHHYYFTGE